ncbi:MAG: hypothetical protein IBX57_00465 [Gammaproteobacteria bacterium]|nr:hypothetical protein [Gammaproteobacteria bacterium]
MSEERKYYVVMKKGRVEHEGYLTQSEVDDWKAKKYKVLSTLNTLNGIRDLSSKKGLSFIIP